MSQFEIPKGWELKKIGDLSEEGKDTFTDGPFGSNLKVSDYTDSGIPIIRLQNIGEGIFYSGNLRYTSEKKFQELQRHAAYPGDVLIAKMADPVARACVLPSKFDRFMISADCIKLRPDCQKTSARYLAYAINSPFVREQAVRQSKGVTRLRINLGEVKKLVIPLPSLPIQEKIVKKLDYVFTQLEEKRQVILERKESMMDLISKHPKSFKNRVTNNQGLLLQMRNFLLDQAYSGRLSIDFRNRLIEKSDVLDFYDKLRDMKMDLIKTESKDSISHIEINIPDDKFSIPTEWIWGSISEIEIFVGSGSTPKGGKSVYVKNGIPFIRSQNVYLDKLHLDDIAFISKKIHDKMSRSQLKPGDVLLNITGASIGRSTVVPTSLKEGNVNQHVCIIRTPNFINPEYLSGWLNSSFIQKMILEKQKGETREGLNYTHIRSLPIPITTLEEQNEIIKIIKEKNNHVQRIEKGLSEVLLLQEKLLRRIDQISNSILDMAFSGKIVN